MSWLLDTNVLSELRRKRPDPNVVRWVSERPASLFHLSVLTIGEIRKGIDGVADPALNAQLEQWLSVDLTARFAGRILPIDQQVAQCWGRMIASAGRPLPAIDSLLAATALSHRLELVTRNTRDFEGLGVPLVNPWGFPAARAPDELHQARAAYRVDHPPIRLWREQRGLSREALAGAVGISISFLAQIESGARKPSSTTRARLEAALGLHPAPAPPSTLSAPSAQN